MIENLPYKVYNVVSLILTCNSNQNSCRQVLAQYKAILTFPIRDIVSKCKYKFALTCKYKFILYCKYNSFTLQ